MKENLTTIKEINGLLSNFDLDTELITSKIFLLEEEVKQVLNQIRLTDSYKNSEHSFKILDEYQLTGAKLLFKYEFNLSKWFKEFISDFDRLDDLETRQKLYSEIKKGKYS